MNIKILWRLGHKNVILEHKNWKQAVVILKLWKCSSKKKNKSQARALRLVLGGARQAW